MWFNQNIQIDQKILRDLATKQNDLQSKIVLKKLDKDIKIIAGCDSSIDGENILSVFVNFSFPKLEILEIQSAYSPLTLPYIPGFLAFREIPNLLKAYKKLKYNPDIIMVDGHGIAHPRRLGIAAHLGVLLEKPTIGVAKKKLVGEYQMPEDQKGSYTKLTYKNEILGFALRSKDKVKPIFISPGNLLGFDDALNIVLKTLIKHKLPEPTRLADKYSKELKQKY